MEQKKSWFIVQTLSGHELKAASLLRNSIKEQGLEDLIEEVIVPTEKVIETVNGKVKKTESKLYPGYIFIKMMMNLATFEMVKSTNYIISFLGATKGKLPDPISDTEAHNIFNKLQETENEPRRKVVFEVGEKVRITSGSLKDHVGAVEAVYYEKSKLRVAIPILGRYTPVDIDFSDVEKSE